MLLLWPLVWQYRTSIYEPGAKKRTYERLYVLPNLYVRSYLGWYVLLNMYVRLYVWKN